VLIYSIQRSIELSPLPVVTIPITEATPLFASQMPQNETKMDDEELRKALRQKQDFRPEASFPGDWSTGLFDCYAPPGGCETCLMGKTIWLSMVRCL